jgi:hypothetical protein
MHLDDDGRPTAAVRGTPSRGETGSRLDTFLLVATVGLLIARLPAIPVRFFDPDELEHSHAAWSLFKGLLPYRDFFEHHTPWYYFALSPFFHCFAVDQSFESARRFLIFGRVLSFVLSALCAALVFRLGRLVANRRVGLLAAFFFVGQPVIIQKTLEIRPDVPALLFFIGALWFLLRALLEGEESATPSLGWFLGGGLCLGAAIMCTQKVLFVLPGAFLGLGLWALAGRRRLLTARVRALLAVFAGVAIPAVVTWIGFAAHGVGNEFIYNNFLLNARWRLRSDRHLLVTLATSWPVLLFSIVGASRARRHGDLLLLCILGGLIAGVPIVPALYRQYYLMPLTIACLLAGQGLSFLAGLVQDRGRAARLLVWAILLLSVWPVVDLARSVFTRRDDRQAARLRYVFEHTGPTDPVLDGWLGTDVFRPHPLYYFFMHGELLAMLSESDKDAYLGALESGKVKPALIALDVELIALGPRFLRFVRSNYATHDGLFYFPVQTHPANP